jgi:hypothetical protein
MTVAVPLVKAGLVMASSGGVLEFVEFNCITFVGICPRQQHLS